MRLVWTSAKLMARPATPWLPIGLVAWILVSWLQTPSAFAEQATPLFASAVAGGFLLAMIVLVFLGVLSHHPVSRVARHPAWLVCTPWAAWALLTGVLLLGAATVAWTLESLSYQYVAPYSNYIQRLGGCALCLAPVATWIPALGMLPGPGIKVLVVAAILAGHGAFLGFPSGISATSDVSLPHWTLWIPASAGGLAFSIGCTLLGRPHVDRRIATSTTHVSG